MHESATAQKGGREDAPRTVIPHTLLLNNKLKLFSTSGAFAMGEGKLMTGGNTDKHCSLLPLAVPHAFVSRVSTGNLISRFSLRRLATSELMESAVFLAGTASLAEQLDRTHLPICFHYASLLWDFFTCLREALPTSPNAVLQATLSSSCLMAGTSSGFYDHSITFVSMCEVMLLGKQPEEVHA